VSNADSCSTAEIGQTEPIQHIKPERYRRAPKPAPSAVAEMNRPKRLRMAD
jgi:hypothetical protein